MTDRQFKSVCTTTFATFRWTNNSPGSTPTIWFAGTRLSEQPIQRYCGACCCASSRKNSGVTCRMASDHFRLFSKRCCSVSIFREGPRNLGGMPGLAKVSAYCPVRRCSHGALSPCSVPLHHFRMPRHHEEE